MKALKATSSLVPICRWASWNSRSCSFYYYALSAIRTVFVRIFASFNANNFSLNVLGFTDNATAQNKGRKCYDLLSHLFTPYSDLLVRGPKILPFLWALPLDYSTAEAMK